MLAAKEGALLLEAVTDNPDAAMRAGRRQCMDRAFEAVERVGLHSGSLETPCRNCSRRFRRLP